MDFEKLVFEEHYIDKAPDGNYWRGIEVLYNGVILLHINFEPPANQWDKRGFYIREGIIPMFVTKKFDEVWIIKRSNYIFDKDELIQEAKETIQRYLNLFN